MATMSPTVIVPDADRAHYMPGAKPIILKLIVDTASRKLLGAQAVGPGNGDKRMDVAAVALTAGMTVDQISKLDLCYAPSLFACDGQHHHRRQCRTQQTRRAGGRNCLHGREKENSTPKMISSFWMSAARRSTRRNACQTRLSFHLEPCVPVWLSCPKTRRSSLSARCLSAVMKRLKSCKAQASPRFALWTVGSSLGLMKNC